MDIYMPPLFDMFYWYFSLPGHLGLDRKLDGVLINFIISG
jgi:hypothetical protein